MPIESHSKTTIRPPYFSPGCWTQPEQPGWRARLRQAENGVTVFFLSHDINDLLVIHGYVGFLSSEFQVLCPMLFERLSMFVLSLLFLCFEASMLCSEFLPGQHHAPQKSLDSHGKWPFVMFDKFKKKMHQKKHADFPYGYGSIPINTIFTGMNIHFNPAILMWTTGVQGFDPSPYLRLPEAFLKITICYRKKMTTFPPTARFPLSYPGYLWGAFIFAC